MTRLVSPEQHQLLTLCAVRVDGRSVDWSLLARQAMDDGGLDRLSHGVVVAGASSIDGLVLARQIWQ